MVKTRTRSVSNKTVYRRGIQARRVTRHHHGQNSAAVQKSSWPSPLCKEGKRTEEWYDLRCSVAFKQLYWRLSRHIETSDTNTAAAAAIYQDIRRIVGAKVSMFGERIDSDRLTYNRLVMEEFAQHGIAGSVPIANAVLALWPEIRRVVDLGCGSGHYVAEFQRRGIAAVGYERSPHVRRYASELGIDVRHFDLNAQPVIEQSDLAMSIEVIEHLPPHLGERLVDLLCAAAPRVLLSAATPGQGGYGHINEQPHEHWQAKMRDRGYRFLPEDTASIRTHFGPDTRVPWVKANVMAFEKA